MAGQKFTIHLKPSLICAQSNSGRERHTTAQNDKSPTAGRGPCSSDQVCSSTSALWLHTQTHTHTDTDTRRSGIASFLFSEGSIEIKSDVGCKARPECVIGAAQCVVLCPLVKVQPTSQPYHKSIVKLGLPEPTTTTTTTTSMSHSQSANG